MHHYDQSAKVYDTQYSEEQTAKIQTALTHLNLDKDDSVLDIGCGTGILSAHLAGKIRSVVGVDISRGLLKEAKIKAKAHHNIGLVLADADSLPFPNQTFDKSFAITLLQNTPNQKATIGEISRASKPDAKIILTGLRKSFRNDEFSKLLRQANLSVETLELDGAMREWVAICTKRLR